MLSKNESWILFADILKKLAEAGATDQELRAISRHGPSGTKIEQITKLAAHYNCDFDSDISETTKDSQMHILDRWRKADTDDLRNSLIVQSLEKSKRENNPIFLGQKTKIKPGEFACATVSLERPIPIGSVGIFESSSNSKVLIVGNIESGVYLSAVLFNKTANTVVSLDESFLLGWVRTAKTVRFSSQIF